MSDSMLFCPTCGEHHRGTVRLDPTGWPTVRWSEAYDPDTAELARHRAAIVDEAAEAFAKAAAGHPWIVAERFLAEVLGHDEEDA